MASPCKFGEVSLPSLHYIGLSVFYRTICEMPKKAGAYNTEWPLKCELGHVTLPTLLSDVMSSTSRH